MPIVQRRCQPDCHPSRDTPARCRGAGSVITGAPPRRSLEQADGAVREHARVKSHARRRRREKPLRWPMPPAPGGEVCRGSPASTTEAPACREGSGVAGPVEVAARRAGRMKSWCTTVIAAATPVTRASAARLPPGGSPHAGGRWPARRRPRGSRDSRRSHPAGLPGVLRQPRPRQIPVDAAEHEGDDEEERAAQPSQYETSRALPPRGVRSPPRGASRETA